MRPILLLEVNEVPWRLLDHFMDHAELPHIREFFGNSQTFTTRSTDQGELSPWITWPSFHRGRPNTEHHIQFLGQDPSTFLGTPIWEEYRKKGHSIGIFGSLQSWPPADPGPGGFFVPDTFAKDASCLPAWVEPFQKFNLKQTGSNARVVNQGSLYGIDSVKLALSLPKLGIRPATAALVARQLVGERRDKNRLARRPIFQAVLSWDIFRKLYNAQNPPAFSTFFTNHVAGIMHRYWDHVFPEDFGKDPETPRPHLETMLFALKVLDRILCEAMELAQSNPPLAIVFASSMGQGPKVWKRDGSIVMTIPRVAELMRACGLSPSQFEPLLAMVPQICVQIPAAAVRTATRKKLEQAAPASGENFFVIDEVGDRLSISLVTPKRSDITAGHFTLDGKTFDWEEAGMQVNHVEAGTGYHIPDGTMAIYGTGLAGSALRRPMLAIEAKNFLLSFAGVQ